MPLKGEAAPRVERESVLGHKADRGFNAAFELVMTPALFAFIGYWVDRWLGTGRVFTVVLVVLVLVYVVWKLVREYTAEMTIQEAKLIADRQAAPPLRGSTALRGSPALRTERS